MPNFCACLSLSGLFGRRPSGWTKPGFVFGLLFSAFLLGCGGVRNAPGGDFSVMLSAHEGGWKNGQELDVTVHQRKLVSICCTGVGSTQVVYDLEVAEGCSVSTSPPEVSGPFAHVGETVSIIERYPRVQCPASFKLSMYISMKDWVTPTSSERMVSIQPDGTTKVIKDTYIGIWFYFPTETAKYWHLEPTADKRKWRLIRTIDEATKQALETDRGLFEQGWSEDCIIQVMPSRGWYETRVGFPWPSFGKVLLGD